MSFTMTLGFKATFCPSTFRVEQNLVPPNFPVIFHLFLAHKLFRENFKYLENLY